ncbi:MAG: Spy/CpxP family protein refolding chaperone [Thermodesulfobacteriota bacterium]
MHPGWLYWWKVRHGGADWSAFAGCGPDFGRTTRGDDAWSEHGARPQWAHRFGDDGAELGAAFGVRRPLRYLAYKLRLDDDQVSELARILDELKTERAQAEVDRRRSLGAFADALGEPSFARERAFEGANLRVQSATRLRDAVVAALGKLHALLDEEQRARLAYLIRTGALQL